MVPRVGPRRPAPRRPQLQVVQEGRPAVEDEDRAAAPQVQLMFLVDGEGDTNSLRRGILRTAPEFDEVHLRPPRERRHHDHASQHAEVSQPTEQPPRRGDAARLPGQNASWC